MPMKQVPYLKESNHHDFGHVINNFHFSPDLPELQTNDMRKKKMKTRKLLNIEDPLRTYSARTEDCTMSPLQYRDYC